MCLLCAPVQINLACFDARMSASSSAFSQKAPLDAVFHCPTGPEPTAIRFSDVPPVRFAFHHLPGTAVWNLAFFPIEKQEGRNAMAAPDRFIAWCKQEQASIEQQLELMEKGRSEQAKILERDGLIPPPI